MADLPAATRSALERLAHPGAPLGEILCAFQTMYLVATALSLAPCALGAGNSDVFARALGSDYYDETSVGEFLLGSRP